MIVIGPSNPIVSIGPILAVPALKELLGRARARGVPVVAVSGIVGGKALKGPADRMLVSLGHESSAPGVAAILAPSIDGFVLDTVDAALEPEIAGARGPDARDRHDHGRPGRSRRLAAAVLDFAVPPPDEDESVPSEA